MAKVKLADVLWDAANTFLWTGDAGDLFNSGASCFAVGDAIKGPWESHELAESFLRSLGCDPDRYAFGKFRRGKQRQGVRYMWLLLAMHVAEDEDIEIEATND